MHEGPQGMAHGQSSLTHAGGLNPGRATQSHTEPASPPCLVQSEPSCTLDRRVNARTDQCFPAPSQRAFPEAEPGPGMGLQWGRGSRTRMVPFCFCHLHPQTPAFHPLRQQRQRWQAWQGSRQRRPAVPTFTKRFLSPMPCSAFPTPDLTHSSQACNGSLFLLPFHR